jgi:hypothetical protein
MWYRLLQAYFPARFKTSKKLAARVYIGPHMLPALDVRGPTIGRLASLDGGFAGRHDCESRDSKQEIRVST